MPGFILAPFHKVIYLYFLMCHHTNEENKAQKDTWLAYGRIASKWRGQDSAPGPSNTEAQAWDFLEK